MVGLAEGPEDTEGYLKYKATQRHDKSLEEHKFQQVSDQVLMRMATFKWLYIWDGGEGSRCRQNGIREAWSFKSTNLHPLKA